MLDFAVEAAGLKQAEASLNEHDMPFRINFMTDMRRFSIEETAEFINNATSFC